MKRNTATIMIMVLAGALGATACAGEGSSRGEALSAAGASEAPESTTPQTKNEREPAPEPGRKFEPEQRWELSDPVAVKALQGTPFGEQEIKEFWTRKGWRLTKHEERYMTEIDQLLVEGKVRKTGHWAQTPFNGVYRTQAATLVDGVSIPAQTEFWMEFCENEDEIHVGRPLFTRSDGYVEEHQGHTDQASDLHPGELRPGRERH